MSGSGSGSGTSWRVGGGESARTAAVVRLSASPTATSDAPSAPIPNRSEMPAARSSAPAAASAKPATALEAALGAASAGALSVAIVGSVVPSPDYWRQRRRGLKEI